MKTDHRSRYWRSTLALTGSLLVLWLAVSFVGPWHARALSDVVFLGFPLSYWLSGQGGVLAYLAILVIYANRMDAIEAAFCAAELADQGVGESVE